jgi:hypothetical protein
MTVAGTRHALRSLVEHEVDFVLVGGLAVNVHGLLRMTLDVDLVLKLDEENIQRAFDALAFAGYKPTLPVTVADFSDPQVRSRLVHERNLQVLRFHSDQYPQTPVDVFAGEPFDYAEERVRAVVRQLEGVGDVSVVSLQTLIAMKEAAGRPQDLADAARFAAETGRVMSEREPLHDADWSLGTWDGHDRAQMERWARMSLDEILQAQEEMAALTVELQRPRDSETQ